MRILHLVHQYPPEHMGGTELYTQNVARALSRQGHGVAIFTRRYASGSGREDFLDEDVAVHLAWNGELSPARRFLATFGNSDMEGAFDAVLAGFEPDLIHVQHLMGMPTSILNQIRQRKIPFVVTLHDFWWVCANAQLITNYSGEICDGPSLWLNCARCVLARGKQSAFWPALPAVAVMMARRGHHLRATLDDASMLIAPSHFVKDWYEEQGVNPGRIQMLKHGIDPPEQSSESGPSSPRRRRFLYAGGLAWQKGVHVLLEAFLQLDQEAELWIAGDESADPEYSARLHQIAGENENQIRFLGQLSRPEIWQTLEEVDVVVVPALWYETFSLIVHEAFAAGVPVVSSRLGALAEAIEHEIDGLLVEAGSVSAWRAALQRLIDEPELLVKMRAAIRPPMTLGEHVDSLQQLYSKAIQN